MAKYKYQGRNEGGQSVNGVIEATSTDVVADQLIKSGVIPLNIQSYREKQDILQDIHLWLGLEKTNIDDLILFSRQSYALIKAGVPIITGLNLLANSARNKFFAETIYKVIDDLEAGHNLADSMSRHPKVFNFLFVNIIRVGETSGRLGEAFIQMHDYLVRDKETLNQIKSAMRYPVFVLITMIAAVFIIMLFVIPKFSQFYEKNGLVLPLPTRLIMGLSDFVVSFWPALLLFFIGGYFSFKHYINTRDGRLWWDEMKIKFILIGDIVLRSTLGRFARSLSMALSAGVPIVQAINVTSRAVGNEYLSEKVIEMREGIERGESLTRTIVKTNVFTPLVIQMVSVGEETGNLDELLLEVAGFYEREVDYDIKQLNSTIEPLLVVAMAGLVLILALGVFLPMWDLVQLVKR